jgi:hypothetical protein
MVLWKACENLTLDYVFFLLLSSLSASSVTELQNKTNKATYHGSAENLGWLGYISALFSSKREAEVFMFCLKKFVALCDVVGLL